MKQTQSDHGGMPWQVTLTEAATAKLDSDLVPVSTTGALVSPSTTGKARFLGICFSSLRTWNYTASATSLGTEALSMSRPEESSGQGPRPF